MSSDLLYYEGQNNPLTSQIMSTLRSIVWQWKFCLIYFNKKQGKEY